MERGAGEAGEYIYGLARSFWIVRRVSGLKNPASSNVVLHALFGQSIRYLIWLWEWTNIFAIAHRVRYLCAKQIYEQYLMLSPESTCSNVFIYLSKVLSFGFCLSLYSIFRGILWNALGTKLWLSRPSRFSKVWGYTRLVMLRWAHWYVTRHILEVSCYVEK